jgi:hypothetical protein
MNKTQAIRWLIQHRRADVPLQDVIRHLKVALSFDPKAMALLERIHAEDASPSSGLPLPPPHHPSRGYWNTMRKASIEPAMAWPVALLVLQEVAREPLESIRVFLDSRMGEQFAHAVVDHLHAGVGLGRGVRLVADAWMARPLDEIARLVYRLEEQPFLVGWIRIMQMP